MNKANVIGTAVGLYLIRDDEKWPQEGGFDQELMRTPGRLAIRTCANTPWPCIMVLVRESIKEEDFGKRDGPDLWTLSRSDYPFPMDASFPYVSCGRRQASDRDAATAADSEAEPSVRWRAAGLRERPAPIRIATVACLVSDGHIAYALTARTCAENQARSCRCCWRRFARIGVGTDKKLRARCSRKSIRLPLRQTWLNLDVGLVRVDEWGRGRQHLRSAADQAALRCLRAEPVPAQADGSACCSGRRVSG